MWLSPAATVEGDVFRRVVALEHIAAGTEIMRCKPAAFVLNPELNEERCHHCFRKAQGSSMAAAALPTLSRCSGCKFARYDSAACQRAAWSAHHRIECKLVNDIRGLYRHSPVAAADWLLMVRLLASRKHNPDQFAHEVMRMHSCIEDLRREERAHDGDATRYEQNVALVSLLEDALKEARQAEILMEREELLKMVCSFGCNNFSVWDGLLVPEGQGVYPAGALLNHSCRPNCVILYDEETHEQVFRTICDVEQGVELCHSYIDSYCPRAERQRRLKEQYMFDCECERCSSALEAEFDSEIHKEGADIDRAVESFSREMEEIDRLLESSIDLEESAREDQGRQLLVRRREAVKRLSSVLGRYDRRVAAATSSLFGDALASGLLDIACDMCQSLVDIYRFVYPPFHPMLGLQLYTLANIQVSLGEAEKAAENLRKSAKILHVSHGPQHRIVAGLREYASSVGLTLSSSSSS